MLLKAWGEISSDYQEKLTVVMANVSQATTATKGLNVGRN